MRLKDKIAIVVGAGQTPGETIGNGRATAICFAREGATVLLVDSRLESAEETAAMIKKEGGSASTLRADITSQHDCRAIAAGCVNRYGRIDILHNNVGISEGDASITDLKEENWQRLMDVNLKGMFLTCKHVLPVMRKQRSGVIINISSTASICTKRTLAYKISKAGINAMTHTLAIENAEYGVRVNAILPGLMDTPMAIERRARERGVDREIIRRERDAQVPLKRRMGTAWDVAAAAVFLASEEAQFITGVLLPVDGGLSIRIG
ncbi:MAG: SDR family oxidoreductase [Deltaproteobacteria bacterium]|nr:SDR family oxidoreductase [Deltaproteobacteria bacterium]MBW1994782.1 SDR family oxidoreductase [Deltaproteobacteria bacterium]MBW2154496.1 SDR family oxidoreductase [Deltaproteobacteria bacterium]